MTVAATNASNNAVGNGSNKAFPFTFRCRSASEVAPYIDGVLQVSGFTVVVNGNGVGGTVTFTTAPADGVIVVILSNPALTQLVSFTNAGRFLPQTHDDANDAAAIRDVRIAFDAGRAVKVPLNESGLTLPSAASRAGKVPAFDGDGNIYAPNVSAANLETLAGISAAISTVAANNANVTTVATNLGGANTIGIVAGGITNVNAVGSNIASVVTVAGNTANINAVAANIGGANTIGTVAGSIDNVNAVGPSVAAIAAVAANLAGTNTIGTVAANLADVIVVSGGITGVGTVAANIGAVNTTVTNLAAILAASGNASSAAASASAASLAKDESTAQAGMAAGSAANAHSTELAIAALIAGYPGSAGQTIPAATRAALAAVTTLAGSAYVYEAKYEGEFAWTSGDQSAALAADSGANVIAPNSAPTGASGAWIRKGGAVVGADLELTVGTAGEFLTLNAALTALSNHRARYKLEGFNARVRILNDGWTMAEQVIANNGVDMGWIEIVSDQAATTIVRSALARSNVDVFGAAINTFKAAFMAANGARMPRIGCIMSMDTSGSVYTSGQCGLVITRGALAVISPGAGFYNCAGLGAHVSYGANLVAPSSVWTGNGSTADLFFAGAVRTDQLGIANLVQANIHDNPGQGIMINGPSLCSARAATVSNSGMDGVQLGGSCCFHGRDMIITGNAGRGFYAGEGCGARLLGTTITGNGNSGIVIDAGARVNTASGTVISSNTGYAVNCQAGGQFQGTAVTAQNNTVGGMYANGGDIFLNGGTITGHPAGKDLLTNVGMMRLEGTVTTTSGSTGAANLADSNVAAFNVMRRGSYGGIFGRGGKSSNRGTVTVGSGVTSAVVTHGVDFTPNIEEVTLTPNGARGSSSDYWVNTMTATTFTINLDVAPGGSGRKFVWAVKRNVD